MVPFTFPPTLHAKAKHSWANAQARAGFSRLSGQSEVGRSERGTFWTILLQIELEEVKFKSRREQGSVMEGTSACDGFN